MDHLWPVKRVTIFFRSDNDPMEMWASQEYRITEQLEGLPLMPGQPPQKTIHFYGLTAPKEGGEVTHRCNNTIPIDAIEAIVEESVDANGRTMALFENEEGQQFIAEDE
jgi:hypothetical protein